MIRRLLLREVIEVKQGKAAEGVCWHPSSYSHLQEERKKSRSSQQKGFDYPTGLGRSQTGVLESDFLCDYEFAEFNSEKSLRKPTRAETQKANEENKQLVSLDLVYFPKKGSWNM